MKLIIKIFTILVIIAFISLSCEKEETPIQEAKKVEYQIQLMSAPRACDKDTICYPQTTLDSFNTIAYDCYVAAVMQYLSNPTESNFVIVKKKETLYHYTWRQANCIDVMPELLEDCPQ